MISEYNVFLKTYNLILNFIGGNSYLLLIFPAVKGVLLLIDLSRSFLHWVYLSSYVSKPPYYPTPSYSHSIMSFSIFSTLKNNISIIKKYENVKNHAKCNYRARLRSMLSITIQEPIPELHPPISKCVCVSKVFQLYYAYYNFN